MTRKWIPVAYLSVFSVVIAGALVLAQNQFNAGEIDQLTDEAHKRGLDYSLTIHNEWTNRYSFEILTDGE